VGLIDEQNVEANIKTLLAEDQLVGQSSHWHFEKVDRANANRLIQVDAKSFDQTGDGRIKYLHDMTARLYRANGDFKQISSKEAVADMNRATLAYGADLKTVISLKNP
jgi:hypothetical protein